MIVFPSISTSAPRSSDPQRPIVTLSNSQSTTISARTLIPRGRAGERSRSRREPNLRPGPMQRGALDQNSFWSFMAAPMSPLILSFPVMYAVVGFCSPATIFSKLSSLAEKVRVRVSAALRDLDRPVRDRHGPGPRRPRCRRRTCCSCRRSDPAVTRLGRPSKNSCTLAIVSTSPPPLRDGAEPTARIRSARVDFDLTPEQELIRDTVRTFARGARRSPSPPSSTSRAASRTSSSRSWPSSGSWGSRSRRSTAAPAATRSPTRSRSRS